MRSAFNGRPSGMFCKLGIPLYLENLAMVSIEDRDAPGGRCIKEVIFFRLDGWGTAPDNGVVDHQNQNGTDDGDQQAVQIQPIYRSASE